MEESEEGDQMSIAREESGSQEYEGDTQMSIAQEESGFQENEEGTQMSIAREESGSQENEGSSLMSVVPEEPGSQENEDGNVHQIVWNTIGKYVGHLTEDEIFKARREFCCCVNSIIDAYQEKLHEVRALKNTIEVWKEKSHDQRQKIKGLERRVDELTKQLASKVCDDCGEKRITEQMGSMSMQENKSEFESLQSGTEVDGRQAETNRRKRPHEDDETDSYSDDQDSDYEFKDVYTCRHASCGYDALLHMLYKMKINFCPSKFIQMIGTSDESPNCTNILNNVRDEKGKFLKKIYEHENIQKGSHQEVLKKAEAEFMDSKQKAGILSYWTESYNHCVNIHKSKQDKMKIYDSNHGRNYIEDLEEVSYLEVVILDYDETDGTPHIVKRWSRCHVRHCKRERRKHRKPGKDKSLSESALKEDKSQGVEQV